MKMTRTESGNEKIIMSKKEWQIIGKKAGWDSSIKLVEDYPGSQEIKVFVEGEKEPRFIIVGTEVKDLDKKKIEEYVKQCDWTDLDAKGWITPILKCDGFV